MRSVMRSDMRSDKYSWLDLVFSGKSCLPLSKYIKGLVLPSRTWNECIIQVCNLNTWAYLKMRSRDWDEEIQGRERLTVLRLRRRIRTRRERLRKDIQDPRVKRQGKVGWRPGWGRIRGGTLKTRSEFETEKRRGTRVQWILSSSFVMKMIDLISIAL